MTPAKIKALSDDAMSDGFEDYGIALSEAATALEKAVEALTGSRPLIEGAERLERMSRSVNETHPTSYKDLLAKIDEALSLIEGV